MSEPWFRIQMEFVVAARDLDRATTLHDRLFELGEGMGLTYDGGFIVQMPEPTTLQHEDAPCRGCDLIPGHDGECVYFTINKAFGI